MPQLPIDIAAAIFQMSDFFGRDTKRNSILYGCCFCFNKQDMIGRIANDSRKVTLGVA